MRTTEVVIDETEGRAGKGLGELFTRHAPTATRLAYVLTGDLELAQDVVQDAFVRVARRLVHLRRPDAFEWYLRRTVVNLIVSNARRSRAERARMEKVARLSSRETVESDSGGDLDIQRALLKLPQRQRTAIVLRYFEDLSVEQTAETMRSPIGTVKSLVARGLAAMRSDIEEAGG